VHLPLSLLERRERPTFFRPLLRRVPARARLLRVSVSAVRHGAALPVVVLDGPVGAAELLGAAQQQLRDVVGMAIARGKVQRRPTARPTAAATRPAHSADSPQRKRRTRCGPGRARRRWHRRAIGRFGDCRRPPPRAARCCHSRCARRGRGAPRGYPSTQPVPEHKTARSPRGSTVLSVWVTVNDRDYSERTLSIHHLASRSRIHQTCKTSESRGNGDCGRRRRREIGRLGRTARERTGHGS
jgi:hypothetical protein